MPGRQHDDLTWQILAAQVTKTNRIEG